MFSNEEETKKAPPYIIGQNLDDMSVEELRELISELNLEIVRLETTKNAKSSHLTAAESLFAKK